VVGEKKGVRCMRCNEGKGEWDGGAGREDLENVKVKRGE